MDAFKFGVLSHAMIHRQPPVYLHENGVTLCASEDAELGWHHVNIFGKDEIFLILDNDIGDLNIIIRTFKDLPKHAEGEIIFNTIVNSVYPMPIIGETVTHSIPLSNVITTNCRNMSFLFSSYPNFEGDISRWDVSNVFNFMQTFKFTEFNPDIRHWNPRSANNMYEMFMLASEFNQDLSGWKVPNIPSKPDYFDEGATKWVNENWRPQWGAS